MFVFVSAPLYFVKDVTERWELLTLDPKSTSHEDVLTDVGDFQEDYWLLPSLDLLVGWRNVQLKTDEIYIPNFL